MKRDPYRSLERVKTLLIVFLSCSAIFLASQTLFPTRGVSLLSRLPAAENTPSEESSGGLYSSVLRPAAFAVTGSEGRYGQLYHDADEESYTQLFTPLAEALSTAGAPTPITWDRWRQALAQTGFYCQYLGSLPLDELSSWLSETPNRSLTGHYAQRLCVTADTLYFLPADGSTPYAAPLSGSLDESLSSLCAAFPSNGARFAWEETGFSALQSDSLLLFTTPVLPALTGTCPTSVSQGDVTNSSTFVANDALFAILQKLSFHPQTNPLYAVGPGFAITDSSETLRISADGTITYKRSDFSTTRYFLEENALDFTNDLARSTLGALAGDGYIYLQNVTQSGKTTTITYGYAFRGAKIDLSGAAWCASFTVEDHAITAFTLRPRRYTAVEGGDVALLPQTQAVAALDRSTHNARLGMVYADTGTGEAMKPFWALEQEG